VVKVVVKYELWAHVECGVSGLKEISEVVYVNHRK
jgi:hypothetical protein